MHRSRRAVLPGRALLAGATWWVLTDGATGWDAWAIGVPAVAAAAYLSATLLPAVAGDARGALRFVPYFAFESFSGAVDVARRALHPRMPLAPEVIRHEVHEASDLGRVVVANTTSLLPGTLTLDVDEAALSIHVLDASERDPDENRVTETDSRVRAMLPAPRASGGDEPA